MNDRNISETHDLYSLMEEGILKRILIHLLRNFAHSYSTSVSVLLEAHAVGELTASEEIQSLMHSMKRSSDQMGRFLNVITDVTRTDDRRPSELFIAAEQAGNLFEVSLMKRNIRLHISVDKGLGVDVPFSVATLAIANLIDNAKDAMSEGGNIHIEAENNGNTILCRVTDQGCGILEDIRDRIFDIGFTTKDKNRGYAGQGLALTKDLLIRNKSHVELSKTSNKGSTFTIHFPGTKKEVS